MKVDGCWYRVGNLDWLKLFTPSMGISEEQRGPETL
jgi:hypothetical protein